jgi:hypothetical protein
MTHQMKMIDKSSYRLRGCGVVRLLGADWPLEQTYYGSLYRRIEEEKMHQESYTDRFTLFLFFYAYSGVTSGLRRWSPGELSGTFDL